MKKMVLVPALLLALAVAAPLAADAAGIANVAIEVIDPAGPTVVGTALTDATGAFTIENLPAGSFTLEAVDTLGRSSSIAFVVDTAAPARLRGLVTEDDLATVSFEVSAFVSPMSFVDVLIATGYRRLQARWNRNWAHANGRLHVRLAGTGLDAVTGVTLTSALGTITSTQLVADPLSGEVHAVFPKGAAFSTLAGPDARRGDIIALQIGVVTAAGVQLFERTVPIAGPRRYRPASEAPSRPRGSRSPGAFPFRQGQGGFVESRGRRPYHPPIMRGS